MRAGEQLRVLVVDDEPAIRTLLERVLTDAGHRVVTAASGREGAAQLADRTFEAVFTDVRMPDGDGLSVLAAARDRQPDAAVVLMTAYATLEVTIEALRAGAREFLLKPLEPEVVERVVGRIAEERRLRVETSRMERLVEAQAGAAELLGHSAALEQVRRLIATVAPVDTTVLVTGESGTGKELVAAAVHRASPRSGHRFVPVNCAALSASLLESEIFGHEAGAFTGAVKRKLGLVEVAEGGTLFLDEIGETDPAFQSKLLRLLQEREFYRVGSTEIRRCDVRVVAATNRDLPSEVSQGRFREDLFYRLNVFPIALSPLRDRPDDILPIARHLLEGTTRRLGRGTRVFAPETEVALRTHSWPGNVRELANAVERAVLLAPEQTIAPEHLPPEVGGGPARADSALHRLLDVPLREARARFERSYVDELLRETGGNVSEAARRAGLGRSAFHELINRVGVNVDAHRAGGDTPAGPAGGE